MTRSHQKALSATGLQIAVPGTLPDGGKYSALSLSPQYHYLAIDLLPYSALPYPILPPPPPTTTTTTPSGTRRSLAKHLQTLPHRVGTH